MALLESPTMTAVVQHAFFEIIIFAVWTVCHSCPTNWYPSSIGSCYRAFVSPTRLNGLEYTEFCKKEGAHPATIYSLADKNNGIAHYPQTTYTNLFIGLTDSVLEDNWVWMDGVPMSNYVDLVFGTNPTQPNGGRRQNCMVVNKQFEMYDFPCCDFSGKPDLYLCLCETGNSTLIDVNRLIHECEVTSTSTTSTTISSSTVTSSSTGTTTSSSQVISTATTTATPSSPVTGTSATTTTVSSLPGTSTTITTTTTTTTTPPSSVTSDDDSMTETTSTTTEQQTNQETPTSTEGTTEQISLITQQTNSESTHASTDKLLSVATIPTVQENYSSIERYHPILTPRRCVLKKKNTGSSSGLESMISDLQLSKNSTNAYKRKKTSVQDNRQSPRIIGSIILIILAIPFVCIAIADLKWCRREESGRTRGE